MAGSHKCTSKTSSPASSAQPQSWVVTGLSLSFVFRDIPLAAPFPVSDLLDGRAAASMCCGCPQCLKQAVATREPLCAPGEHPGHSGSGAAWAVWPGKEILVFRSCSPWLQLR